MVKCLERGERHFKIELHYLVIFHYILISLECFPPFLPLIKSIKLNNPFEHISTGKLLKKILTYRSGVFLVVEMPHIGLLLKWDRGTRVYLRLENRWKGKVQGLCGNYNYDALDDFLNPSHGTENNPIIFGHSWKLDDSCASE